MIIARVGLDIAWEGIRSGDIVLPSSDAPKPQSLVLTSVCLMPFQTVHVKPGAEGRELDSSDHGTTATEELRVAEQSPGWPV